MKIKLIIGLLLFIIIGCDKSSNFKQPKLAKNEANNKIKDLPEDIYYESKWIIESETDDIIVEVKAVCNFVSEDECDLVEASRITQAQSSIYSLFKATNVSKKNRSILGEVTKDYSVKSWSHIEHVQQEMTFSETSMKSQKELEELFNETKKQFNSLILSSSESSFSKTIKNQINFTRYLQGQKMRQDFATRRCRTAPGWEEVRNECEADKGNFLLTNKLVFLSDILISNRQHFIEVDPRSKKITSLALDRILNSQMLQAVEVEILSSDPKLSFDIFTYEGDTIENVINPMKVSASENFNQLCDFHYDVIKDPINKKYTPYSPLYDSDIDKKASLLMTEMVENYNEAASTLSARTTGELFLKKPFIDVPDTIENYFLYDKDQGGPCDE